MPLIKLNHSWFKTHVGFRYCSTVGFLVKEKFALYGFVLCGYLHYYLQLLQSTFLISISISSYKFGFMTLFADITHKFPFSLFLLYKLGGLRPWFFSHVGFILWNKSNVFGDVTCDLNPLQRKAKSSGIAVRSNTIELRWLNKLPPVSWAATRVCEHAFSPINYERV